MALLCRYLIEGNSWVESKKIVKQNEELKPTWIKIEKANLNNGGYVLDVMHSAMFFLDRTRLFRGCSFIRRASKLLSGNNRDNSKYY